MITLAVGEVKRPVEMTVQVIERPIAIRVQMVDSQALLSAAYLAALEGKVSGSNAITVGTTAPSTPAVGDLWIDTN